MSLVSDKYSENDPVPCSIDDLSITEIRDELKKIGVKMRLKNRDKLFGFVFFGSLYIYKLYKVLFMMITKIKLTNMS